MDRYQIVGIPRLPMSTQACVQVAVENVE
jgi:hypothetical protein